MNARSSRSGLSLLEVTIAAAILLFLSGGLFMLLGGAARTQARTSIASDMNGRVRDVFDRLGTELADAQATSAVVEPGNPGTRVRWHRVINFDPTPGQQIVDTQITVEFAYDDGEADNGLDDNNDGRVDEGLLVRRQDGQTLVLCRDVREGGLAITRTINSIELSLTLERLDERGHRVPMNYRTTINMRN